MDFVTNDKLIDDKLLVVLQDQSPTEESRVCIALRAKLRTTDFMKRTLLWAMWKCVKMETWRIWDPFDLRSTTRTGSGHLFWRLFGLKIQNRPISALKNPKRKGETITPKVDAGDVWLCERKGQSNRRHRKRSQRRGWWVEESVSLLVNESVND